MIFNKKSFPEAVNAIRKGLNKIISYMINLR